MNEPAVDIGGLRKAYGDREALCSVDLVVQPGQVLALLGVNGAGKSTLASIVTALVRSDAGEVRVFGRDACLARLAHRPAGESTTASHAPRSQEHAGAGNLCAVENDNVASAGAGRPSRLYVSVELVALTGSNPLRG